MPRASWPGRPPTSRADAVVLALARDRYTSQLLSGLSQALPQAALLTGDGVLGRAAARWPRRAPTPAAARGRGAAAPARARGGPVAARPGPDRPRPGAPAWPRRRPCGATRRCASRSTRSGQLSATAGPPNRAGVIHAALAPRVRRSPIGTYEVRRNGSVEGLPMALYKLRGDRFEFVRTLVLRADFLRVKQSCDFARRANRYVGCPAVSGPQLLGGKLSRVRWLALLSCMLGAVRVHRRRMRQQTMTRAMQAAAARGSRGTPDDLLEPPASGNLEGAVRGRYLW